MLITWVIFFLIITLQLFRFYYGFRQLSSLPNRPSVASSKNSHFQNEAKCKTFLANMSFIYIRTDKIGIIFTSMASHLASFWGHSKKPFVLRLIIAIIIHAKYLSNSDWLRAHA